MKRFLVALSLGPVQSLIGAARNTRDLWCGSWLLSEAARAAAQVFHRRHPGCLIFPCPEDPDVDLEPRNSPGDAAGIANVLRAEIAAPDVAAVRALCDEAKSAAASRLIALGDSARRGIGPLREEVWQAQIDDILEGFAAWAPLADDGYAAAGRRLRDALAARKATRDFRACKPLPAEGLPKSSLDGARETVLPKWRRSDWSRRKLRLSDGEQLDALGVMKRLAGDSEQFTAWPRIAADPWIRQLSPEQQQRLCAAYEPLVELDRATRTRGNGGIYGALPFDASLLYRFRLDNALSRARKEQDDPAERRLADLRGCIDRISKEKTDARAPVPYAAILKADGDRMGALLSKADSADSARDISSALRRFASKARDVVREHRGHAVYAGGDDVLAFLPLTQARTCSRALADAFKEALGGVAKALELPEDERPTLSVGLGIGHVMEPMIALRARAEKAEHAAKGDATDAPRNALAVVLGVRSGAELHWRAQWSDTEAFDALDRMTEAFRRGLLPTRAAYDLRGIDRRLAWLRGDDGDRARGMRSAEVGRMLDRARLPGGTEKIRDDLRELIAERARAQPLRDLADALIVARWFSARAAGDLGERA